MTLEFHTVGCEGWTVPRYRQFPGQAPGGLPEEHPEKGRP